MNNFLIYSGRNTANPASLKSFREEQFKVRRPFSTLPYFPTLLATFERLLEISYNMPRGTCSGIYAVYPDINVAVNKLRNHQDNQIWRSERKMIRLTLSDEKRSGTCDILTPTTRVHLIDSFTQEGRYGRHG